MAADMALLRLSLLPITFALAVSCSDDHADDDHHSGGNEECQALGSYCHDAGEIDAEAQECHEEMHEAEEGCVDRLDECQAICDAVYDQGGSGGGAAGGAGGIVPPQGGAGGEAASEGGAAGVAGSN